MPMIYKYPLPMTDRPSIDMPHAAKVLSVVVQNGAPVLYALVDPSHAPQPRHFRVAGTGHPIEPDDAERFIGTILLAGDALVFHVFEL